MIYPSGQTRGITIRNNLFYDISTSWGGNARLLTMGNEPADIVLDHNTYIATGSSVVYVYAGTKMLPDGSKVAGGPVTGFRYTNNLARHNSYGINTPAGTAARGYATWLPDAAITNNVLAGAVTTKYYPPSNHFPTVVGVRRAVRQSVDSRLLTRERQLVLDDGVRRRRPRRQSRAAAAAVASVALAA